ncbi:MAG: WG repeat-containing protein [Bacteroidota bacterium]
MRTTLLFIILFISLDNLLSQTIFPFRQGDKWLYVDSAFKPISSKTYSFIFPFANNRAIVKIKNKYGVIDNNERIIIKPQYDTINYYYPNFNCAKKNKPFQFDINGKPVEIIYGICGGSISSSSMLFAYKKNKKFGILSFNQNNYTGDSLPAIYDEIHEFNTGIIAARIGDKWGTINYEGVTITDFILDKIIPSQSFDERDRYKLTKYVLDNKIGFLNGSGKIVSAAKFKELYFTYGFFSLVKTLDNRLVYIDNSGHEYFK